MQEGTKPDGLGRREVLLGGLATLATCCWGAGGGKAHDDDLILLLSDCHVAAGGGEAAFPYRRLKRCVDAALALDPLPTRAFVLGDIAGSVGPREDYEMSARQFVRLEEAGIAVSYAMGNHDRRAGFLAVHPECAAKSPIKGRLVRKIELPACDFLFLDSLIGEDGSPKIVVAGAIDAEQSAWLEREVSGVGKPVIVCAHHAPHELKFANGDTLERRLPYFPRVRGYIHGHVHRWSSKWCRRADENPRFMRVMSLPATGNWGDLGYALMRIEGMKVRVRLFQDDYRHSKPLKGGVPPPEWTSVVEDNRNAVCTFDLAGPMDEKAGMTGKERR